MNITFHEFFGAGAKGHEEVVDFIVNDLRDGKPHPKVVMEAQAAAAASASVTPQRRRWLRR